MVTGGWLWQWIGEYLLGCAGGGNLSVRAVLRCIGALRLGWYLRPYGSSRV
jgi:hypothetical protein